VLNLVWTEAALGDLDTIITYIAEHNLAAALRLQSAIEACAERLPEHPSCIARERLQGRAKPWCTPTIC
jgi:plasmid stabilization system protein ParE